MKNDSSEKCNRLHFSSRIPSWGNARSFISRSVHSKKPWGTGTFILRSSPSSQHYSEYVCLHAQSRIRPCYSHWSGDTSVTNIGGEMTSNCGNTRSIWCLPRNSREYVAVLVMVDVRAAKKNIPPPPPTWWSATLECTQLLHFLFHAFWPLSKWAHLSATPRP